MIESSAKKCTNEGLQKNKRDQSVVEIIGDCNPAKSEMRCGRGIFVVKVISETGEAVRTSYCPTCGAESEVISVKPAANLEHDGNGLIAACKSHGEFSYYIGSKIVLQQTNESQPAFKTLSCPICGEESKVIGKISKKSASIERTR